MGSEQFVILNPKGNNKLLRVSAVTAQGKVVKLATLRPGQSFRSEKSEVSVRELPLPPLLSATMSEAGVYEVA